MATRAYSRKRRQVLDDTLVTLTFGVTLRPEVVARGKRLLAAGKVGHDVRRLADRLIEHALEEGEWLWTCDR